MLSIIIPTKNEEKFLPLLLDSIKKQSLQCEYEIIVADAGSTDRTCAIARDYGCTIIEGGMPAVGRNRGARVARGDLVLFLDADVVIHGDLKKAFDEFENRDLDVASCFLQTSNETKIAKILYEIAYNFPILILENTLPHGADFMLARRDVHERIGGFDEEVRMSEDHDYMRRGAKEGKFGLLRSVKTITSSRRYDQDGWVKVCLKFLACEFHMVFIGSVKSDIFLYRFDPYCEEKRVFKTPWAGLTGWRAPFLIFWFLAVAVLLWAWYCLVAFLFVWLNFKKRVGKFRDIAGRILFVKQEQKI